MKWLPKSLWNVCWWKRTPPSYLLFPTEGKRNEPAFVKYTALEIARLRGMDFQALADATSRNARTLFKLRDLP
jgi:Tat protein secretion system quality control protein TatD with DNase activity